MPILGTIASSRLVAAADTGSMYALSSVTIPTSGSIQEIVFSNIPQTYTHLQVRGTTIGTVGNQDVLMQLNGITSNGYSWHEIRSTGSGTPSTGNGQNVSSMYVSSNSTDPDSPTSFIVDILDYRNTNKNKVIRVLHGKSNNATTGCSVGGFGGIRLATDAITSLRVFIPGAYYYNAGSVISLYGVNA